MIVFPPDLLKLLMDEAEAAYPAECCGLLVGKITAETVTVTRVVPSPNLKAAEGNDRFEIDPKVRFDIMRETRDTDDDLIGLYHSHPDHPAQPSKTDLDLAWEPDLLWVIVAVRNGQAIHSTAHRLEKDGTRFVKIPLRTEDWGQDATRAPIEGPGLSALFDNGDTES